MMGLASDIESPGANSGDCVVLATVRPIVMHENVLDRTGHAEIARYVAEVPFSGLRFQKGTIACCRPSRGGRPISPQMLAQFPFGLSDVPSELADLIPQKL